MRKPVDSGAQPRRLRGDYRRRRRWSSASSGTRASRWSSAFRRLAGSGAAKNAGPSNAELYLAFVPDSQLPDGQPRRGRDSIAQGAAERSPGLPATKMPKAPTGRNSIGHLSHREGITARWAFRQLFVAYAGLRRLSRLRPGLSNFAPFGAPLQRVGIATVPLKEIKEIKQEDQGDQRERTRFPVKFGRNHARGSRGSRDRDKGRLGLDAPEGSATVYRSGTRQSSGGSQTAIVNSGEFGCGRVRGTLSSTRQSLLQLPEPELPPLVLHSA